MCRGTRGTDGQTGAYEERIETLARTHPVCKWLMTPSLVWWVLTDTGQGALVRDPFWFKNGHFAAYLGLLPRQHSSGGKNVLLGISKR
ncbi:MAG: transposase [Leptospirales bacterium]